MRAERQGADGQLGGGNATFGDNRNLLRPECSHQLFDQFEIRSGLVGAVSRIAGEGGGNEPGATGSGYQAFLQR